MNPTANPIGANTWIWTSPLTDGRLAELTPRIAAWGFDLVELPVENPGDWDPDRAAEVLRAHDLAATVCAVMPPGRELVAADPETIAATQDYLRTCVDAAAVVGPAANGGVGAVVAGPIYASVGRKWRLSAAERARLVRELAGNLAPVAEYAAESGVRLALEPLNRFETSLINTVEQATEVVDAVGSPALGLLLDTFHMNIEERSIPDAIRMAADRVYHFHACASDRGAPGADHLDWDGIVRALDEVGYEGAVVIESFTAETEAIATAAAVWRPLAGSQDGIATDGLAFLRRALDNRRREGGDRGRV
jgi:D-psicose/D-tagatose/L-ribulose 3-epimerase